MTEYQDRDQILRNQVDTIVARQESGVERSKEEQKLLRAFLILISDIIKFDNAYKKGLPIENGRPVTSQEISMKQKELWMLCPQIKDMSGKTKIVEIMKNLHPQSKVELEVR